MLGVLRESLFICGFWGGCLVCLLLLLCNCCCCCCCCLLLFFGGFFLSVKAEKSKCFKNAREAKAHRGFTWKAIHCITLKQLLFLRPLLERITT